jgi:hypothetical protein
MTRGQVIRVVRPPVRPATRWIRVVPSASARRIAGRMVARQRASIDFPATGGPMSRTFESEHLHSVLLDEGDGGHVIVTLLL